MKIDEICRARADFYAFLSRMFVEEPPFELAEDIARGQFPFPETSSLNEEFSRGIDLLAKFMKTGKDATKIHRALGDEYTRLFLGPVPVMFPYESMYVEGSMMSKPLLTVKKEYRMAGLTRVEGYHEPEDHIAMELGFMSRLCQEQSDESLRRQRDFLHNHLLKWVPGFCNDLCRKSDNDFWKGIGKLTEGFMILEKDVLGELAL
ncbi:MAG TPA: molecular chaperone TorD family protein [Candidatus Methanoperedens sp.]